MIFLTSRAGRAMAAVGVALSMAFVLATLLTPDALADVSTINSAIVSRRFIDIPTATFTGTNSYPSISLKESGVSASTGFSNQDIWQFSNNGGVSAYQFQNGDYFQASFDLTMDVNPDFPQKMAGFLFQVANEGDVEFVVTSDSKEVIQFGGISAYSFTLNNGINYNLGQTIQLGLNYFQDSNGKNALQFFANGTPSPIFEFGPTVGTGALDIGNGSTLGGFFQVVNDPFSPGNGGTAVFSNISISGIAATPEPSALVLLASGFLGLILITRR